MLFTKILGFVAVFTTVPICCIKAWQILFITDKTASIFGNFTTNVKGTLLLLWFVVCHCVFYGAGFTIFALSGIKEKSFAKNGLCKLIITHKIIS
ncbi:hypothetical protein A9G09_06680 [Gilliamella sp. wkB292]|uniref:hypothetical protein n=1 Tax=Gilliamella sp. wkB292 TaxID=3120262 RepID=UPI00080EB8F3|nr:hypothetical protein [Gilliamella apicola]OCG14119.1 hypothetical protein A9G09_06680 [Gilliamella apicola]